MSVPANPASAIAIRACVPGDEHALAQVGQATFLETFAGVLDGEDILEHCKVQHAPEIYSGWLADARSRAWLAEAEPGRAPVGYLVLAPAKLPVADPQDDDLEIKRIYLLHRFRGGGLGRRLLGQAIEYAKRAGCRRLLLGVYADNDSALAFYARCGFIQCGERRFQIGAKTYADRILALDLAAMEPVA